MTIPHGVVHKLPADFEKAITSNKKVTELWQDITPLARNEWICWVTSGKLAETRNIRIKKGFQRCQLACADHAVGLGVRIGKYRYSSRPLRFLQVGCLKCYINNLF